MSRPLSDTNREVLPPSDGGNSEQPAAVETAAIETAIGGKLPQIPRPNTTPILKVNKSS